MSPGPAQQPASPMVAKPGRPSPGAGSPVQALPPEAGHPRRAAANVLWELKQLHNLAIRLEERVGDLYWDVYGSQAHASSSGADDGRLRARGAGRPPLATVAWVTKLTSQLRSDGSLLVSLNGKAPFPLQPHLGALLLALAEDTGLSRDEGVGFKTLRDLSVRIGKRTGGRGPSPETINKYVCKLRRKLSRAGAHADLIQTNRRLGRRLAIKRSGDAGSSKSW